MVVVLFRLLIETRCSYFCRMVILFFVVLLLSLGNAVYLQGGQHCDGPGAIKHCQCRNECADRHMPIGFCMDRRFRLRTKCCPMWFILACQKPRRSQTANNKRAMSVSRKHLRGTVTSPFDALANIIFSAKRPTTGKYGTQLPPLTRGYTTQQPNITRVYTSEQVRRTHTTKQPQTEANYTTQVISRDGKSTDQTISLSDSGNGTATSLDGDQPLSLLSTANSKSRTSITNMMTSGQKSQKGHVIVHSFSRNHPKFNMMVTRPAVTTSKILGLMINPKVTTP